MDFDEATAVQAVDADEYRAQIGDQWDSVGGMPNGGYLLAVAARALRACAGRPDPLTVSGLFLRRGQHGPASLRTGLLKEGKRLAFGTVLLGQQNGPVLHAHGAFGDLSEPQEQLYAETRPPELPEPESCVDLVPEGFPGATLTQQVEYRVPEVPGWARGRPSGRPSAELWLRLREDKPIDPMHLLMLVDSMAPVVVELGRGSTTVELTVHVRSRPAPGWLACRVATRNVRAGYHEEDVELWDSRGVLVAQSRQLGMLLSS